MALQPSYPHRPDSERELGPEGLLCTIEVALLEAEDNGGGSEA
jgi:hypothetical protein